MSVFGPGAAAESDSLAEAVHSLAIEIASSRAPRGPFRLVCQNHSSLSVARTAALCEQFRAQLAVVPNLLAHGGAAPVLSLTFQETASHIVILLRMPVAEGERARLLEVSRADLASDGIAQPAPYATQQLLWKQREPILNAVEHKAPLAENTGSAANGRILLVLGRASLSTYREAPDGMIPQSSTQLPGLPVASRIFAGTIKFAGTSDTDFTLTLPDKFCTGNLAQNNALRCGPAPLGSELMDIRTPIGKPAIALAVPCDQKSWMLASSDGDRTVADRLMLIEKNGAAPSPALDMAGPVLSLGASADPQSAVATVFNLATGEYELYRITLACRN